MILPQAFHEFLSEYEMYLDQQTTFELISSHGQMEELLHYAQRLGEVRCPSRAGNLFAKGHHWCRVVCFELTWQFELSAAGPWRPSLLSLGARRGVLFL